MIWILNYGQIRAGAAVNCTFRIKDKGFSVIVQFLPHRVFIIQCKIL